MIKEVEVDGKHLKYLCKCISWKDPHKYKGSGVYWRRFLKKHNLNSTDIKTTILGMYDKKELRIQGEKYSKLFNVTESTSWANLCDEIGDGGATTKTRKRIYNPITKEQKFIYKDEDIPAGWLRGSPSWKKSKEAIESTANFHKGRKRSEETRERMRNSTRKKRVTVECEICHKQFTKQNIERHSKKCS